MQVKVPESVVEQTLVTLRSDRLALHSRASAKSCLRQGAQYLVGLEFIGGLLLEVLFQNMRRAGLE